ncbi:MAG: GHMP family kinase ATP-binding protein [Gaiellaceae bacterium]
MIVTRAPLRITLGGGGTDLPSYYEEHGGFVVCAAIDKYVYVCVNRPASDDLIRLKYSRSEEVAHLDELEHDLARPALKELEVVDNVEIASMADIPAGTGLGSSGSYLVALLTALHELKGERVPPQALAELAVHIELDLAGHPIGKQDPYAATFGGIIRLDIQRDGRVDVSPLHLAPEVVESLSARLLLFSTGISRSADTILAEQRRDSRNGHETVLDSLHRTKEMGHRAISLLEVGRLDDFGLLLHEHWENKKRRSGRISTSEVDAWYERARTAGALGGKLVGAGGGGFLMLYCPRGTEERVRDVLAAERLREVAYRFDHEGAKVLAKL